MASNSAGNKQNNGADGFYRARTLKRKRRTKIKIETLDQQIVEALQADWPQSVRHVFYQMTNPRLPVSVEKSQEGYRTVQSRMVKLRRANRLPYGWVADATRRGHHVETFYSEADFLTRMKGYYRSDLWALADSYCEVWTESRSIAGVVENTCRELAVSLYPAGGFASLTLAHQASEVINQQARGRPAIILYIGDYDPAGVLIDISVERELRQHLDHSVELEFRRIAITPEQIAEYDLPTKPRKATDRRSAHVTATVEAEAMPAGILKDILRCHIECLLPERALEVSLVAENSAREYFENLAEITRGSL